MIYNFKKVKKSTDLGASFVHFSTRRFGQIKKKQYLCRRKWFAK